MDQRGLSLHERCRRRGSLPLKKRRLSLQPVDLKTAREEGAGSSTAAGFGLGTASSLEHSGFTSAPAAIRSILSPAQPETFLPRLPLFAEDPHGNHNNNNNGGDEKLAALALLTAARGLEYLPFPLLPPTSSSANNNHAFGTNVPDALAPGCQPHLKALSSRSISLQSSESFSTSGGSFSDADSTSHAAGGGVSPTNSTTATSPLPGGCHGKNSKTNAYCRKRASYLGSNYCKLHYLQCAGGAGTPKQQRPGAGEKDDSASQLSLSSRAPPPPAIGPLQQQPQPPQQQQDKRFTGAEGEVCCRATTTRGRPCTFVAADGSTVCHLHSPSKASPPYLPRRDSECYYSDQQLLQSPSPPTHSPAAPEATPHSSTEVLLPFVSPVAASSLSSPSLSSTAVASGSRSGGGGGGGSKRRAKYNDSPHPLLSKVPVDRWFGTHVRIACGPLQGKVGCVEKWGNGWITVRIPGIGPHNRRSFELYVVGEHGGEAEDAPEPPFAPPLGDAPRGNKSSPSILLRSTVSPSPSSDSSSVKGQIVHKVSYSYDGEEAASRSHTDPPLPAVVINTPQQAVRAVCGGGDASSLSGDSTGGADLAVPKVTPVTPKAARTELPLAESLVLAQEVGAKKYRLDMLFGTAALERGRRSIHRPSRYDDDQVLSPGGSGGGGGSSHMAKK